MTAPSTPSTALVLSGGGALGAFEAGVLRYALDVLCSEGLCPRLDLLAGTSVGALNCSLLGAYADDPRRAGRSLASFWESLTFDQIFHFGSRELAALTRVILGPGLIQSFTRNLRPRPSRSAHPPVAGLFNADPLHENVRRQIPWSRLQRNLEERILRGIAVCATEVCTGTSIIFYQTARGVEYREGRDPSKEARSVCLAAEHALASSAIPFLFPSVQVDGICYTDGALRQNTPLNPALRMGADRLLVISVTQDPRDATRLARIGCRLNPYPGALFLLGKTVKVLLTQSLDYELNRVEMYNRLIAGGNDIYGREFCTNLNRIMGSHRNATYRPVRTCHIRPSKDLDRLALQALKEAPEELRVPGLPGKVVSKVLRSSSFAESELLSLLMFTPTYIRMLLELGYKDAEANREALIRLFSG